MSASASQSGAESASHGSGGEMSASASQSGAKSASHGSGAEMSASASQSGAKSASHGSGGEMNASASHGSGAEMSASASHSGAEMSASASHGSGTDAEAREATSGKASEMKSGAKKTHVPTKAELQTALKNWSASSVIKLNAADSEREFKHSETPEWECIICNQLINRTPVYQCQTGHLACSSCSQKGINCHSCSKAVSRIRNLAVENMIKSLVVTCKFAKLGCKQVMKFEEFEESKHEENCSFMPMFCPMPGCKHAGVRNRLAQHLLSEHDISSLVDVGELQYSYSARSSYSESSKEFDVDSSTALVMLRNMRFQEFHLLKQQCTAMGDRLEIKSLAKTCKRKYELVVKVGEELTYCYKSSTTSDKQPTSGLLIPKQSDGETLKKRCKEEAGFETDQAGGEVSRHSLLEFLEALWILIGGLQAMLKYMHQRLPQNHRLTQGKVPDMRVGISRDASGSTTTRTSQRVDDNHYSPSESDFHSHHGYQSHYDTTNIVHEIQEEGLDFNLNV